MSLKYCTRIGLKTLPPATEDGLRALQLAQRLSIPFENLDIRLGREISLDHETIFEKLVRQRRGGYCFEQNLLLAKALDAMAITHRPTLARVWLGASSTPPLTHLVLLVNLDKSVWLMDAGFGGGYCPPLLVANGSEVKAPDGSTYRLGNDPEFGWILDRASNGQVVRQFSFVEAPAHSADILLSNHWTSTHPTSLFKQNIVVNQITNFGRLSLVNNVVTDSTVPDKPITITSTIQLSSVLENEFELRLSSVDIQTLAKQMDLKG